MVVACVSLAHAVAAVGAVLRVNTTADELAPHNGKCSLREAIAAVDSPGTATDCGTAGRRSNTIVLRAGQYRLSIAPSGADNNATGGLNLTRKARVKVQGAGRTSTVIDAAGLGDRVVSVASGAVVTLSRLKITGGRLPGARKASAGLEGVTCSAGRNGRDGSSGGGIYNEGTLKLRAVAVTDNAAGTGGAGATGRAPNGCSGGTGGSGGGGGGIYNRGRLTVTESTICGNRAGAGGVGGGGDSSGGQGGAGGVGGAGGQGGGINSQGRLVVNASTTCKNRAGAGGRGGQGGADSSAGADGDGGSGGSGGGIYSAHRTLRVTNSTFAGNFAGAGGAGAGLAGDGGGGGDGGAIQVTNGASRLLNATVADNGVGSGGAHGSAKGTRGAGGSGGGLSVQSSRSQDDMTVQNTIVASSIGSGCAGNAASAIADGGHDLSFGDRSCPGGNGNPRLGTLTNNGGPTATMALGSHSAAIDRVPRRGADCPPVDQRGVHRPQGKACDIGAFEFALPMIRIISPRHRGSYQRRSRIRARFRCTEGGIVSPISACRGTVRRGHAINTRSVGAKSFTVTAVDKSGHRVSKTVHYTVWAYANPLRKVSGLETGRIDMGVDYAGSGPLLALGKGRVTVASDHDSGPVSCWGRTCWPGGGIVVYRLTDGPFAGKYVYVAENITVSVRPGQRVRAGEKIATLHEGSPDMETGWASGKGPETLAIARRQQCPCGDPGGWSTIEGRNFDDLLVWLGAPSGYLQPNPPRQRMPRGWPKLPPRHLGSIPRSPTAMSEGAMASPPQGGSRQRRQPPSRGGA